MGILQKWWDINTDVAHKLTGTPTADEARNQQRAVNDQIKAYKDQTEITKKEIALRQGQLANEKRKVNEKQIRSLRNQYRSPSILGTQQGGAPDTSSKLGG